ncbi:MAG TPA: DUF58 domain-containing protein [Thermoanaerobaculia bacterium]|nr:DUF58 domain-containing protein [Thermoanaerobaculia bacterium]
MTTIPSPAPAPFAFDGVVRLTRTGTTFIIFTVVIGFAALNTGNNPLYIGLTFMLGSLLLSGLASKGGLRGLDVAIDDIGEAWAGRPADAVLRITNRSRLWNVRDIIITSEDIAEPLLVPQLGRGRQEVVHATLLFRRRGHVELKSVDLYTRYPFGFFMKKRRVSLRGEMIVFPRLLDEQLHRDRFRTTTGEQTTVNRPGAGSEVHSFREFAHGDSLRHVYWKKSASLGRWIIKQTELDVARAVQVLVDPYRPRGTTEDEFEQMVSEATTFVHQALSRGLDVVLQMPRVSLRSKDGQGAHSMFRALALVEPSAEPVHQAMVRNTVVFAVGERP